MSQGRLQEPGTATASLLDSRAGQIHRGLGVVIRWAGVVMVIPSEAAHDSVVDQMLVALGPVPTVDSAMASVNELLATRQLKSIALVTESPQTGLSAMAFGAVEILIDGVVALTGGSSAVRQDLATDVGRITLRASNLAKAAEPVAPYDLRLGIAPGAGLTLAPTEAATTHEPPAVQTPTPPDDDQLQAPSSHDGNQAPSNHDESGDGESSDGVAEVERSSGQDAPAEDHEPGRNGPVDSADPVSDFADEQASTDDAVGPAVAAPAVIPEARLSGSEEVPEEQPPIESLPRDEAAQAPSAQPNQVSPAPSAQPARTPQAVPANSGISRLGAISVPLLGPSTNVPAPLPPLPSGDEADSTVDLPRDDRSTEVEGIICARNHFNNPANATCMVCGLSLVHLSDERVKGPRPTLGFIVFDNGDTFGLDRSYVIGREPQPSPQMVAEGLVIRSDNETLSRTHAELRLVGWQVQLMDRGSTNGTYIWNSLTEEWVQLTADSPVELHSGATVALGRRTFVFEGVGG